MNPSCLIKSITIGTFSIFTKEYNTLTINSINTETGLTNSTTKINYSLNDGSRFNQNGFRDTIDIINTTSIDYNYLLGQLLTITGLTQSN